ncbi:ATP-binding protein [Brachybacterium sp. FME24]|uniref:ATP-binding protein n=1 Tax=Brachybacterium sp. FME24 TaxID=2742605 RepID=UPI001867E390|nr:ATP-binding protein [Brachybacterium sp. FME24]
MTPLITRHLLPQAEDLLGSFPAVVIQGARQVGKSTLASMIAEPQRHMSVSFDDVEVRESARLDPRAFVRQAHDGLLIIDEVQRDPSVLLAIKAAIDANRRPGQFLLTGSSDLLRLSRSPDSLAGRAVTLDLHGLSQGEIAGRKEDFAAWVRQAKGSLDGAEQGWSRQAHIDAIVRGGFPEIQKLPERHHGVWFDNYLDRLLTRDVGDVSRGLSSDRLAAVLRLVAANQGGELIQARLADELSIARSSISAYLAALSTLYLTHDLPPWRANLTKREVGRHKVAVADAGLAARLSRLKPAQLAQLTSAPALGAQLEAFVVAQLFAQRGWSAEEYEIFHFRDRDGLEVDVVLEFPDGRVFLLEVKSSSTIRADHSRGIRALAERLGDRFLGGAVLGLSTESRQLADRIWGLPISALWRHP